MKYNSKWTSQWIENRLTTAIYCSIEPDELCYLCVRQTTHISFRSRKYLMWWNSHCHFVVTLSQYVRTFIAPIICSHLMYYSRFSLSLCFFFHLKKKKCSPFCMLFAIFFLIMFTGLISMAPISNFKQKFNWKNWNF